MFKAEKFNRLYNLLSTIEEQENKNSEEKNLFDAFFNNSPIPMAAWSVSSNGKVLVQKGNGIINHNSINLEDLFKDSDGFENLLEKHEEAFTGNQVEFTYLDKDRTFQVKLIPVRSENYVEKVMGIAIDVTLAPSKTFYSINDVVNRTKAI